MNLVVVTLVRFARHLRSHDLAVEPSTGRDLWDAARLVGPDRADLKAAFRSLVVTSRAEIPVFDEAFERFFGDGALVDLRSDVNEEPRLGVGALEPDPADGIGDVSTERIGASSTERLATRDFGDLTPDEIANVKRLITQMDWHRTSRLTRRWVPDRRGTTPHMRRSFRNALGPAGELMELELRMRRPRPRPLVILADVSGSMERYVEMFLHFAHAAPNKVGPVETFVFSTRLTRITESLNRRDPSAALSDVADTVHDWSGGTRIGEAIRTYNQQWSRRLARGGPVGTIISDGWDCGDPALLAQEMARFARSVHRVIWLNPLAGRPGYSAETRGMMAALPFVDDFLGAANLTDLDGVVGLLGSISKAAPRRAWQEVRAS